MSTTIHQCRTGVKNGVGGLTTSAPLIGSSQLGYPQSIYWQAHFTGSWIPDPRILDPVSSKWIQDLSRLDHLKWTVLEPIVAPIRMIVIFDYVNRVLYSEEFISIVEIFTQRPVYRTPHIWSNLMWLVQLSPCILLQEDLTVKGSAMNKGLFLNHIESWGSLYYLPST